MRALFDQLLSEGEAGIERLIQERTQETVHLDFKLKRDPTKGRFDDDDRKVFGKALSAFANSDGGLLVWGVDARKGQDEIDCAQGPSVPISDIEQFRSEAIRHSAELLIPRHDGIHVEQISSTKNEGSGYLLVKVDRSDRRPHRCEAKGDKHYYKRAGDSSFAMEHYDIEDAFRRLVIPTLEMGVRYSNASTSGDGHVLEGKFDIYLENRSSVTAKMPYIQLRSLTGAALNRMLPEGVLLHNEGGWITFSGNNGVVVHPGLARTMASYQLHFEYSLSGSKIQGKPSSDWELSAECRFGSENTSMTAKNILITEGDLVRMMRG